MRLLLRVGFLLLFLSPLSCVHQVSRDPQFLRSQEVIIVSDDGRIKFGVERRGEGLFYQVILGDRVIIKPSPISITIDGVILPGDMDMDQVKHNSVERIIEPVVPTIFECINENFNEAVIQFKGPVRLRIRVYNDGVAYRWETSLDDEVRVNDEEASINFQEDFSVYFPVTKGDDFFSHQENMFKLQRISDSINEKTASVPVLFDIGEGGYLLYTDVNVEGYPGLWLKNSDATTMKAIFPKYPATTELKMDRNLTVKTREDYLAITEGTRSFPWRAFVMADSKGLLESTLLYLLAEPSRLRDTSWITPGKVSWDWWNAWNIYDMSMQPGINQHTYKNYIDFASLHGLEYVILDEGWSVQGPDHLLEVVPELDIPGLVEYAHSKGVGLILWMTSTALEQNFGAAFEQFTKWGIKGLKVDFMQRDDQVMMDFCVRVAKEAAKHELVVDFHGGSKPTGLHRTYPNVLTHESVVGLENSKWSEKASPDMAVTLPFIRMMAGPMDYTPGAMDNMTRASFRPVFENPGSLGTRCHQLAMYVIYLSPLQMLADTPSKYRQNRSSMDFLSVVPTIWHETRVFEAEVGKYVLLARRHGETWFIGAMTNWEARNLQLPLDFLAEGSFHLKSWIDGDNAHAEPKDMIITKAKVTNTSSVEVNMAPGGGYAAVIEPLAQDHEPSDGSDVARMTH